MHNHLINEDCVPLIFLCHDHSYPGTAQTNAVVVDAASSTQSNA